MTDLLAPCPHGWFLRHGIADMPEGTARSLCPGGHVATVEEVVEWLKPHLTPEKREQRFCTCGWSTMGTEAERREAMVVHRQSGEHDERELVFQMRGVVDEAEDV